MLSSQGYVLRGWVDLTSNKPHVVKKSIKYLEQGTQDTKDVLGLMGKVGRGSGGVWLLPWSQGSAGELRSTRPEPTPACFV